MLCSMGNACSPTVLGWWCLFLPYKSLVRWDAWLGLVESTGSRAPLRVCSEGFAARMPSHSLPLPSSSSRVLRGVSVSKVAPHLSSLFLASEAALGTKFTTFSWFPEQIKALHWPNTAFNRGAATHCSKISRTAALAVWRKMFNQGIKMFVWETGAVQSPSYLQYLTMMAPEQLSLEHSRGMRWNWTGMAWGSSMCLLNLTGHWGQPVQMPISTTHQQHWSKLCICPSRHSMGYMTQENTP